MLLFYRTCTRAVRPRRSAFALIGFTAALTASAIFWLVSADQRVTFFPTWLVYAGAVGFFLGWVPYEITGLLFGAQSADFTDRAVKATAVFSLFTGFSVGLLAIVISCIRCNAIERSVSVELTNLTGWDLSACVETGCGRNTCFDLFVDNQEKILGGRTAIEALFDAVDLTSNGG